MGWLKRNSKEEDMTDQHIDNPDNNDGVLPDPFLEIIEQLADIAGATMAGFRAMQVAAATEFELTARHLALMTEANQVLAELHTAQKERSAAQTEFDRASRAENELLTRYLQTRPLSD